MSTAKYFSGTTELASIRYFSNAEFATKFPNVRGVKVDGYKLLNAIASNVSCPSMVAYQKKMLSLVEAQIVKAQPTICPRTAAICYDPRGICTSIYCRNQFHAKV